MDKHVLVKDEKYEGKYVAMKSILDQEVVAYGDNPVDVVNEAKQQGFDSPLLAYVPPKDIGFVF